MPKNLQIKLVSFEKNPPNVDMREQIQALGVDWRPLAFGRFGILGGVSRLYRLFLEVERNSVVHARSDIPAFAAILKGAKKTIWDSRALMVDQRMALRSGSKAWLYKGVLHFMERTVAKKSMRINVLTSHAKKELSNKYSIDLSKFSVIPTCVDIDLFELKDLNLNRGLTILISGTISSAYDIDLMNEIIESLKKYTGTKTVISLSKGHTTYWQDIRYDEVKSLNYSEMPEEIARSSVGFAIWKNDLGVALKGVAATKVAEFLAVGKPVIVNSLQGDIAEIVRRYRVGVVTSLSNQPSADRYATELLELLKDPELPKRCRKVAIDHFNLSSAVDELVQIYSDCERS
jgi:glycosyltransferase involved in cell wall biosynthesis